MSPAEVQYGRAEEDEDPGVDDGVDGEEEESNAVCGVALLRGARGVDVHSDLRNQGGRETLSQFFIYIDPTTMHTV